MAILLPSVGCEFRADQAPSIADIESEHAPIEEVNSAQIHTTQDGRPRLRIEAPRMRKFDAGDSTYVVLDGDSTVQRVVVRLFDDNGQPSAVVQANQVRRIERDGRFEARGNVEVVNVEGSRLEAEELRWQEDERIVRSGGFVRIRTPNERIEGYRLEAAEDLAWYRLERVTGQVTIADD